MSLIRKAFKRLHYPVDVIDQCVRWNQAYSLSLRNLEEMMAERGVVVTIPRFTAGLSAWCPCWIRPSSGINVARIAGDEWMKPASKSGGSGKICTGQLIPPVRPLTALLNKSDLDKKPPCQ